MACICWIESGGLEGDKEEVVQRYLGKEREKGIRELTLYPLQLGDE